MSGFTQWAADNVDHNVATPDGSGTFHGMGVISMSVTDSVVPSAIFSRSSGDKLVRMTSVSCIVTAHRQCTMIAPS